VAIDGLLARYLQERRSGGDDGRTFLIGFSGRSPVFALAAGLSGADDHPRFLTFARYLVHHRFRCDGYALLLPAVLDGEEVYVAEWRRGQETGVSVIGADGQSRSGAPGGPLIGDLARPQPGLPGIMRRELDRLYEALRRPLPGADQG
jgi:hypothetical protein